jgi:hypothetical protein
VYAAIAQFRRVDQWHTGLYESRIVELYFSADDLNSRSEGDDGGVRCVFR